MSRDEENIPISKLHMILQENTFETLAAITDLDTLKHFLTVQNYKIKNGTSKQLNFPVKLVLKYLNNENVRAVCEVLKLCLKAHAEKLAFKRSLSEVLKTCSKLKSEESINLEDEYKTGSDNSVHLPEEIASNYVGNQIGCMNKVEMEGAGALNLNQLVIKLEFLNILLEDAETPHDLLELELGTEYLNKILSVITGHEKDELSCLFLKILPNYLRIFEEREVVAILWEHVAIKNDLRYICALSDQIISKLLLPSEHYWNLLQQHLCSREFNKYKTAVYLLRLSLAQLQMHNGFTTTESVVFYSENSKATFFQSMESLCVLLDVTWEKQLHLVEPSLLSLKHITGLHPTWLLLIYRMLLRHNHSSVVYLSIIIILQSGIDFKGYLRDVLNEILNSLNNAEYITLTKQAYSELSVYASGLNQNDYELLLQETLAVKWVPVGFWCVYKHVIDKNHTIPIRILNEIIHNAKLIPHKYTRKGCLDYFFNYIQKTVFRKEVCMREFVETLLEFLTDENIRFYACKLINNKNLVVDAEMLEEMKSWLVDDHPNIHKIDLIVETVNRKNVSVNWIRECLHVPFKKRKYSFPVLDRLSYTYCIKTGELEHYLNNRLDVEEENCKICMIDKSHATLIDKSVHILTSDFSCEQQALAFEILFYANENRFKYVYKHWFNKVIYNKEKILTVLALGLVNLLAKIPLEYLRNDVIKFQEIIEIYEHFFDTQPDEVSVKIFRNIDLVLERVTNSNLGFVGLCITQLRQMKRSECFETAARFFIRSFALSYEKIDGNVAEFVLRELFEFSKTSDVIVYYSTLYFKQLKFDLDVFPMYEYILFGSVFGRDDSAEYEICKDIYFNFFSINPSFRTAEIHKWTIENILSDVNEERISRITKSLIEKYMVHFKKRYYPDSLVHLHKLRIIQTFSFIIPYMSTDARKELKDLICESFCEESHQASVRQLMQYILIQLLKDEPFCLSSLPGVIEKTEKTHTSTITGFIPVMYGLELLKNDTEFSMNVVETILPWTMGAHFKLRLYSQLVIKKICDKNYTNRKFKQKFDSIHKALETIVSQTAQIEQSIIKDLDLIKHIYVEKPHNDSRKLIHLISIYIPETTGVTPIEWEYFKIKNAFTTYMKDNREVPMENFDLQREAFSNVQKKIVPWQEFLGVQQKTGELILVTSLIDSLANLGGLSRTCEIFGVKEMVVNNGKVVNEKEFQSLSMSSEKWVNISEVKIGDLKEFILRCKNDGYKCVGAEQTSDSVDLNSYRYDEKTLILLGNERSGIPPNLILLLDQCVEIPQFGMVRSLNVHVAGAMFIWEYVKQHMIK